MIRLLMSDRSCGRLGNAGIVCALCCLLVAVAHVAIAQGPPDGPPTDAGAAAEEPATDQTGGADREPEPPGTSPEKGERRNPFKRIGPQPLTPEQREEAERLRKVAAKYGTDPTAIVGRMQLTSQYLDLTPHANATITTARIDLPFRSDYLLRMEMPFLRTTDGQSPGMGSQRGLSDLAVTAGWRAYNTPEYALLVGAVSS